MDEFIEIILHPEEQVGELVSAHVEAAKSAGSRACETRFSRRADKTAVDCRQSRAGGADEIHLREAEGEGAGGGGFKVMGFIHDEVLVFGQHAVAGDDIRQQEGMVDDEDVGGLGGHAHLVEGAGAAGAAHADFGFAAFILGGKARPNLTFAADR